MIEPNHYWKFLAATKCLAGAEAPLRQRLLWALMSLLGLRDEDIPEPMRATYLEIRAHVTWKQDGDQAEGLWKNTLEAMSDEDARKVSDLFVKLFEQTCRELPPAEPDLN